MKALLTLGAVLLVLSLMGAGIFLGLRKLSPTVATSDTPASVAIMVVGSPENVETFRESLNPEQIVASSTTAFAIDRGRIIADRIEAGSDLLNQLGWTERPLEIIDPRSASGPTRPKASGGSEIAALAKNKTLTPAEAVRALQLLR